MQLRRKYMTRVALTILVMNNNRPHRTHPHTSRKHAVVCAFLLLLSRAAAAARGGVSFRAHVVPNARAASHIRCTQLVYLLGNLCTALRVWFVRSRVCLLSVQQNVKPFGTVLSVRACSRVFSCDTSGDAQPSARARIDRLVPPLRPC